VADLVTDGATGRLCAADDVGALAAALVEVLADEPRQAHMGRQAQAIARRRFDLERITADHASIYHAHARKRMAA
jgi:glycosyltransferase involved in cell wall biosynthesis